MNDAVNIIFGATGGIGSSLARMLAADGSRVVLAGRTKEPLDSLASELGGTALVADATDSQSVEAVFAEAKERFGRVDGVAHCVGSIIIKPAHLTSDAEWLETVTRNLTSAFFVVRSAARAISGAGSVVLVSSCAARIGLANHEAIAAAKAGIIGLTLSAAASYASRGLRFNAVAPGLVRTPMSAKLTSSEASLKASVAMHPLGKIGEPSDVASAIRFLLDPANSWVTGQVIGIDGGLATVRPR